jgi:ZIP family zinc transporter
MIEVIRHLGPVMQALVAGIFTWGCTGLGAATIFFVTGLNRRLMDGMLGFAGGVMIAATFWSMLAPAISMSHGNGMPAWAPAAIGFAVGGIFLRVVDRLLPHLHDGLRDAEGLPTPWRRTTLLVLAMTLHNIPEGLAVGVAFGAAAVATSTATIAGAIALAIGIGVQDFPEGMAAAMPLRREGMRRLKSFWYGQLTGIVEPLGAVIGAAAVFYSKGLLPYALGFASGAMIFVVVEQVVPESQRGGHSHVATWGTMLGFIITMILEVSFV